MHHILRHFSGMLPYMALILPFHIAVRLIALKLRKVKINWYHEIAFCLFVSFVAGLASQTILSEIEFSQGGITVHNGNHNTALIPFRFLCYMLRDLFVNHSFKSLLIDFLGNIAMFMPFGFFLPLLWRISGKATAAVGFCVSLSIELIQLFLPRWTDIDDLILNTSGTLLGLLVFHLLSKYFHVYFQKFRLSRKE